MTGEELRKLADELSTLAMNVEDGRTAELLIRIAARLRTVAREGVEMAGHVEPTQ